MTKTDYNFIIYNEYKYNDLSTNYLSKQNSNANSIFEFKRKLSQLDIINRRRLLMEIDLDKIALFIVIISIIIVYFAMIYYDILTGKQAWGCVFHRHEYYQDSNKNGMAISTVTGKIEFTERKMYKCRNCGKYKRAEKKDWLINTAKKEI